MYKLIRPILFCFSPEFIHNVLFFKLRCFFKIPGIRALVQSLYTVSNPKLERNFCGLTFKNPVGLAAGFDKNAQNINELAAFGFGFIEIGTVTPLPQDGNPKPRLFRLPEDKALINRMGFNNVGAEKVLKNLKKKRPGIIVGGNIGKNKVTPNDNAKSDYIKCFEVLYPAVDYFVVNVSSPNTPGLRELQDKEPLISLLQSLQTLNKNHPKEKPILLKIAPDLSHEQLDEIVEVVHFTGIQGLVATNTTISREGLRKREKGDSPLLREVGGLSGAPLKERSTEVISHLRSKLNKGLVIIGVGGIFSADDALEKIEAGADLIQIYTGFIYEGPGLIRDINRSLRTK